MKRGVLPKHNVKLLSQKKGTKNIGDKCWTSHVALNNK